MWIVYILPLPVTITGIRIVTRLIYTHAQSRVKCHYAHKIVTLHPKAIFERLSYHVSWRRIDLKSTLEAETNKPSNLGEHASIL